MRVAGLEPLFVSCIGSAAVAPTNTLLKLSEAGVRLIVGGVDTPTSEMNSREVLAFNDISIAPTKVATALDWGVKVTVRVQLAPGTMVVQLLVTGKSGVD